jgi:hypothetical protein
MSGISFSEAIQELRSELKNALEAGEGHEIRFKPGPIELEMTIALQREGAGKGSIKIWVAELGGEAKMQSSSTHRIKISLQAIGQDGLPLEEIRRAMPKRPD